MEVESNETLNPDETGSDLGNEWWETGSADKSQNPAAPPPNPQYSILTEQARNLISLDKQCALFCGGRKCKYERADCWPNQMDINGLFSHWVTDDILAMARPNTAAIKEFDIIKQFKENGIKTVINLQQRGEHASCGPGLDPSGFSYNPQDFMDSDIYFYNFGCPDFGASSNGTILDMVRVMQFALTEGKVAIHCHAGLGRTGLLICCFLVFTQRLSANDAIHYVRSKRPRSIQTRRQMQCLKEFADYLQELWVICTFTEVVSDEFTVQQYLSRQRKLLHGYEGRKLKYIPKIIYFICERMLELAERGNGLSSLAKGKPELPELSANLLKTGSELANLPGSPASSREGEQPASATSASVVKSDTFDSWWMQVTEHRPHNLKAKAIAIALCDTTFEAIVLELRDDVKQQLNDTEDGWKSLAEESDPLVLASLLWDWLNRLKEPVLRYTDLKSLLSYINDPLAGISTLEKSPQKILNYLSRVVVHLLPLPKKLFTRLLEMLLSHLTHHYINTNPLDPLWRCDHWLDLQPSTPLELLAFFKSLIRVNYEILAEKKSPS